MTSKFTTEQLALLRQEYSKLDDYYQTTSLKKRAERWADVEKSNSTCPGCNKTGSNVIEKIKRIQGDLEGALTGSYSSSSILGTGFGSGSLSGKIKGEIDTNEILYCKSCETEWKKKEDTYVHYEDTFFTIIYPVMNYFDRKEKINEVEFNPEDLSEKFSSLDEKKNHMLKELQEEYNKPNILREYHVETVKQFLEANKSNIYSFQKKILEFPEEKFEEWGCKQFEKPKAVEKPKSRFTKFFASLADLIKS